MWRRVACLFFLYVIFEGALRKWVLPAYSNELFVLKDAIVAAALALLLARPEFYEQSYLSPNEGAHWVAWILLVCAYALVDSAPSIRTLVGIRYYFAALPLLIVVPHTLKNWQTLDKAAIGLLLIAIAICVLGFVQYASPRDAVINRYAWTTSDEDMVSGFGVQEDFALQLDFDHPRVTGTFSYISTYAAFLQCVLFVGWVIAINGDKMLSKLVGFSSVGLSYFNIAMTGSRAALLLSILLSFPFAAACLREAGGNSRRAAVAALLVLGIGVSVTLFSGPFQLLIARDEVAGDTSQRAQGAIFTPYNTVASSTVLGEGIGSTFGGLGEYRATQSGNEDNEGTGFDEVNVDRVGIEIGVLGYLFVLGMKLLYVYKAFALYRNARSRYIRSWGLATLCYQLAFIWVIPLYNAVASSFYFASIGLYFWLRRQNEPDVLASPAKTVLPSQNSSRLWGHY